MIPSVTEIRRSERDEPLERHRFGAALFAIPARFALPRSYARGVSLRSLSRLLAALCLGAAAVGCSTGTGATSTTTAPDRAVVRVPQDAATLTEAASRVAAGGTILLAPGHYTEQLQISTANVTVRGEDRNTTVIDGGGIRPYGIVVIADGVRVENLTVTGATFYGVLFTGLHDANGPSAHTADGYHSWDPSKFPPLQRFRVDHVTAHNNGLYGIYAFNARHGVITDSYTSGSADSGIYVGQCTACDILVSGNVAERNAVGFENANASDSVVLTGNRFSDNRVGMTLLSSYQEAFTPQRDNHVVGNLISDNNESDSPSQAEGGFGTGIGISGGQGNTIQRNRIAGHQRAGVVLANTEDLPATKNMFSGNTYDGNRVDLANVSADRTAATGNCADDANTAAPDALLAQLRSACTGNGTATQSAEKALAGPDAPPGQSYKKVAGPPDQPSMTATSTPAPLPATVDMPDLAAVTVPAADLLESNAGSR